MEAVAAAVASVLVALIGLLAKRLETTRKDIKEIGKTNISEHKTTELLLEHILRDVGGCRADIRHLDDRLTSHIEKGTP